MGNKPKRTQIKIFDFIEFQHMIAEAKQHYCQEQGTSQQDLYHGFKCTIINHKGKQIEGLCINEYCKAFNRRTCFDCIIQKIHDKEQDQQYYYPPQNADELNQIINQYQQFLSNQIDCLEYQYYFQQLLLVSCDNEKLAWNNFQVLEKIGSQLENIKRSKTDIKLINYIQIQSTQNIGIFNYFQQHQQQIYMLQQNITEYTEKIFKVNNSEAMSQQNIKQFEMEQIKRELFEDLKKKQHIIIMNIIETKQYKNKEANEKDDFIKQLLQIGNTLFEKGEYENFLQFSEFYLKFNHQDPNSHFRMGFSLDSLKRYDEAIQMYDRAIQLNPQYSNAYNNKGISLKYLKRYDEAIQMYDRAIQLDPQYSEAYYNKGISLYALKRYDEAIQMYDRALQLNPQDSYAYNNKGISLYALKRYHEAIQMYDRALQLNPQHSSAYNNKGISLYALKRYHEAIQMYDRAIQLNPQYSEAYNNKGISLYELKRYHEAIQMYDRAIQLNPQYSDAYNNKGSSLINLKRYDEAIQMYDRALQLNPQHSNASNNKEICLKQKQNYQQQQDMILKQ